MDYLKVCSEEISGEIKFPEGGEICESVVRQNAQSIPTQIEMDQTSEGLKHCRVQVLNPVLGHVQNFEASGDLKLLQDILLHLIDNNI